MKIEFVMPPRITLQVLRDKLNHGKPIEDVIRDLRIRHGLLQSSRPSMLSAPKYL